ncbi:S-methyl-5'-thioadenosine phosphorylase [Copidosoma floridanum]|uniref:S-methyl-5'-thioadenosine phosphorylase n=1 Tax=Copidosoma floridanum TaxID=29053 RepID=UPI0006C96069|nr:S-methyl-5'-thioadenosine phosphorylase [Copidosoma floridanum]XP_014208414.1 S-methyl-5'-thioadenosine phosphorylase [Copidosoma floridanum]XP_014208415.1 S-methyl-5'-thioadenosine phosphorylase [Copidosoma floridanum]
MGKYKIKIGIIGGSGLEDPANQFFKSNEVFKNEDAKNEFGLPSSHLCQGTIAGIDVVLLSRHGSGHKKAPTAVNYRANIEALRLVGCTHILASTACGSLAESIGRGQLVIPDSFIDRTVHRKNTFYDGTSANFSGVCYVPCEPAFDPRVADILEKAAKELDISVKKGATVVTIEGPRYSSKAESNMFRQWGGHLINMTTCPEVYLAKEAGLLYAAVAIATDYDCWKDSEDIVCAPEVIKEFKKNVGKVTQLIVKTVELIGKEDWDQQIDDLKTVLKTNNISH